MNTNKMANRRRCHFPELCFVLVVTAVSSFVLAGCSLSGSGEGDASMIPGTYINSALSANLTFKSDNTYTGSSDSSVSKWRQSGRWEILSNGHIKLNIDSFEAWDGADWVAEDSGPVEASFRVTDSGIFFSIKNQYYPDGSGGQEKVTIMVASRRPEGAGSGLTGTWDSFTRMDNPTGFEETESTVTIDQQALTLSYTWSTDVNGSVESASDGPVSYTIVGNLLTIDPSGLDIQERFFKIDEDHFVLALVESTDTPPTAPVSVTTINDVMYVRQ